MRRNRYGGYRGRRTGQDFLKILIGVLLGLALVLAGILYLGRDTLLQPEEPSPEEEQQEQQASADPVPEEEPEPEPEPEPAPFVMTAVGVDMAQVLDGSWEQTLALNGANAVVLNMKPDDAALNWVSGQAMAAAAGANSQTENINQRIRALTAGETYTVARVSCFRDELLAGTHAYCVRTNSDYRWQDFGRVHWTSPAVPEVQDYLVALAEELAQLGFDEILLDNCGYPQDGSGEMGWIKHGAAYDLENLDAVVSGFLDKMTAALEPYGVKLSIRTNAAAVANGGAKTGVTGAVLEQYAGHIWISEVGQDAALAELLTLNGVTGVGGRLVTETAILDPGASWQQALLGF